MLIILLLVLVVQLCATSLDCADEIIFAKQIHEFKLPSNQTTCSVVKSVSLSKDLEQSSTGGSRGISTDNMFVTLTEIRENLRIDTSDISHLKNSFRNLISVGGSLLIRGNNIEGLSGFHSLKYVQGNFEVELEKLESLDAFQRLEYVGGHITFVVPKLSVMNDTSLSSSIRAYKDVRLSFPICNASLLNCGVHVLGTNRRNIESTGCTLRVKGCDGECQPQELVNRYDCSRNCGGNAVLITPLERECANHRAGRWMLLRAPEFGWQQQQ